MPDHNAYQRSEINWPRLGAYASRVARETNRKKAERLVEIVETRPKRETKLFGLISRELTEEVRRTDSVVQDYWILIEQYFKETTIHQKQPFHRFIETERYRYCLGQDGLLFVETWTELERLQIRLPGQVPLNQFHTTATERKEMTSQDVERFDYYPRNSRTTRGKITIERNDGFGRLRYHTKGQGLSKALGRLLE